jgi:hypothetical protein
MKIPTFEVGIFLNKNIKFGSLFLIQSLRAKSIRVYHLSPAALNFSITSGERRMVVETLVDSNAGLPTRL